MAIIKLSGKERRRLSLFAVCLLIAVVSWLFFALSNKYTYNVNTKLHYTDLPKSKAFYPLQSDSVMLTIEGTGWQLLFSKLRLGVPYISLNLQDLERRDFIPVANRLSEINRQIESDQRVISIFPDTLFFDFSVRTAKRVPVKPAYKLDFERQFGVAGKIETTPKYVNVSGPAGSLDTIKAWPTDSLILEKVSKSISRTITLKSGPQSNISVYPNSVRVNIPVEEFTEKTVNVPIKVLDGKNYEVRLLPRKVKITFLVSLSSYPKVENDMFEAVVDLKNWAEEGYSQLPVKIAYSPQFCKIIRVDPQTVDFILK